MLLYLQVILLRDLSVEVDIPENEELEEFIIEAIQTNAISVSCCCWEAFNVCLHIFVCYEQIAVQ